jgi:aspartate carbamoyltransferase catalytic subunit
LITAHASPPLLRFPHRHLLGIEGHSADKITFLLDLAASNIEQGRQAGKKSSILRRSTETTQG